MSEVTLLICMDSRSIATIGMWYELLAYQIEGLIVLSHTLSSEKLASYHIPIVTHKDEKLIVIVSVGG